MARALLRHRAGFCGKVSGLYRRFLIGTVLRRTAALEARDTAELEIRAMSLYRFGEADGAAVAAGRTPAPESGAAEEADEL